MCIRHEIKVCVWVRDFLALQYCLCAESEMLTFVAADSHVCVIVHISYFASDKKNVQSNFSVCAISACVCVCVCVCAQNIFLPLEMK